MNVLGNQNETETVQKNGQFKNIVETHAKQVDSTSWSESVAANLVLVDFIRRLDREIQAITQTIIDGIKIKPGNPPLDPEKIADLVKKVIESVVNLESHEKVTSKMLLEVGRDELRLRLQLGHGRICDFYDGITFLPGSVRRTLRESNRRTNLIKGWLGYRSDGPQKRVSVADIRNNPELEQILNTNQIFDDLEIACGGDINVFKKQFSAPRQRSSHTKTANRHLRAIKADVSNFSRDDAEQLLPQIRELESLLSARVVESSKKDQGNPETTSPQNITAPTPDAVIPVPRPAVNSALELISPAMFLSKSNKTMIPPPPVCRSGSNTPKQSNFSGPSAAIAPPPPAMSMRQNLIAKLITSLCQPQTISADEAQLLKSLQTIIDEALQIQEFNQAAIKDLGLDLWAAMQTNPYPIISPRA